MASEVNDKPKNPASGLWLSVTDLAKAKGVSKPAITQIIQRWAQIGTPVSTRKEGKKLLVNVAEFDRIKGEVGDLVRDQTPEATPGTGDPVFAREQARRMAYDADLKQLELDEKLGNLVPTANADKAGAELTAMLNRACEQIPARAEDMAAAVAKDGVAGGRSWLKLAMVDLRNRFADELERIIANAVNGTDGEREIETM